MAKIRNIPIPYSMVYANSQTATAMVVSGWFPRAQLSNGRAKMEVRNVTLGGDATEFNVAFGFQYANCESDTPTDDTTILLHDFVDCAGDEGVKYPSGGLTSFATASPAKYLCRIVIYVKVGSGETGLSFARVGGMVELQEC